MWMEEGWPQEQSKVLYWPMTTVANALLHSSSSWTMYTCIIYIFQMHLYFNNGCHVHVLVITETATFMLVSFLFLGFYICYFLCVRKFLRARMFLVFLHLIMFHVWESFCARTYVCVSGCVYVWVFLLDFTILSFQ